jgi:hypothetical protein
MRYIRCLSWLLVLVTASCVANAATSSGGGVQQLGFRLLHRCVLHKDGAVDCVSESHLLGGSLGNNGAVTFRSVQIVARGATQLSVGGFAACAIVGGALDCWNDLPATGKPGIEPKRIIASGVTDVSVGDDHACAVAHGAALCWGSDSQGQSGHDDGDQGNGPAQSTPWQVIAHGVTQIAAGGDRSCAVADSALWCWGRTGLAEAPHFNDVDGDYPPVQAIAHGVSAIAAGRHHVCAVANGALWCWGDNSHGQVGLGYSRDHAQQSPNVLPWNPKNPGVFADGDQTCISQWQDIACRVEHPVKVIAYGVTDVFASYDETCALVSGALMCWGNNWDGQLGIGSGRQNVLKPTMGGWKGPPGITSDKQDVLKPTMAIPYGVTFVALNPSRACAVMKDGALSCTLPCTKDGDALKCPKQPRFVAGDPTDISGIEARVGIWRGTIGDSKVMVCLERPYTLNASMYYYLRHRFSIALSLNGNFGATWDEAQPGAQASDSSKPAAVWTLQSPVGDVMDGTWSAVDGSREVPIQLTRIADAGKSLGAGCDAVDGSSARLAFNAPRVASQKLSINQPKVGGFREISALDGHVSMAELPASMPYAARFNAAMHDWLADKIAGYYECASSSLGGTPDYNETSDIDLMAAPWLVVKESYSVFCGGAHPSSDTSYMVWNLATGKTVNPWDFIKDSHWDYMKKAQHCDNADDCERRPPPKLDALLRARFRHDSAGDSDCEGSLDAWPGYVLHPEKGGLVFSTDFAFVRQACDEDIELSWKALKPFLTSQGKDAMRSLHQGR